MSLFNFICDRNTIIHTAVKIIKYLEEPKLELKNHYEINCGFEPILFCLFMKYKSNITMSLFSFVCYRDWIIYYAGYVKSYGVQPKPEHNRILNIIFCRDI